MPVVALRRGARLPAIDMRYSENNGLVEDGVTSFLLATPAEAHDVFRRLFEDRALGRAVAAASRVRAEAVLGRQTISAQWSALLGRLT